MAILGQDPVASSGRGGDEVVMDDFIYGEPQRLLPAGRSAIQGSGRATTSPVKPPHRPLVRHAQFLLQPLSTV
jgi:hypothetical protein